jgi:hypothetical protein
MLDIVVTVVLVLLVVVVIVVVILSNMWCTLLVERKTKTITQDLGWQVSTARGSNMYICVIM